MLQAAHDCVYDGALTQDTQQVRHETKHSDRVDEHYQLPAVAKRPQQVELRSDLFVQQRLRCSNKRRIVVNEVVRVGNLETHDNHREPNVPKRHHREDLKELALLE